MGLVSIARAGLGFFKYWVCNRKNNMQSVPKISRKPRPLISGTTPIKCDLSHKRIPIPRKKWSSHKFLHQFAHAVHRSIPVQETVSWSVLLCHRQLCLLFTPINWLLLMRRYTLSNHAILHFCSVCIGIIVHVRVHLYCTLITWEQSRTLYAIGSNVKKGGAHALMDVWSNGCSPKTERSCWACGTILWAKLHRLTEIHVNLKHEGTALRFVASYCNQNDLGGLQPPEPPQIRPWIVQLFESQFYCCV